MTDVYTNVHDLTQVRRALAQVNTKFDGVDKSVAGLGTKLDDQQAAHDAFVDKYDSYTLLQQPTGRRWLNGREIYRKVINTGALPNATSTSVAHGITRLAVVVSARGFAFNSTKDRWINVPQ